MSEGIHDASPDDEYDDCAPPLWQSVIELGSGARTQPAHVALAWGR